MRVAYADPPCLGCCGLYEHYHPGCSGAFPPHRCKCGWDEAQAAARAVLSPVGPRPEQR